MTLLVNDDGSPKTYVIVDTLTKGIVAASNWSGDIRTEMVRLQAQSENELAMHNLTHSKCPEWVIHLVKSDKAYCVSKAALSANRQSVALRKAAALLTEADEQGRRAAEWRTLAERG